MDYGEPKVYFEVYGTLIYEIFRIEQLIWATISMGI